MPDLDNLLNWYFFRYLAQTKPNFLYELHINLGISHKDILGYYEGEKVLEFSIIKKICNHWSLPTKLWFDERNLNLKGIDDMGKKKTKAIIPGIPDSELDPPVIVDPLTEGSGTAVAATAPPSSTPLPPPPQDVVPPAGSYSDDPLMKVVTPAVYEMYFDFFAELRLLAFDLTKDGKTPDEVKLEIFNRITAKMIDKNRVFDMETINPYYVKIVEALLA